MSFEEWWNTKDYPVSCKGNCKEAYEAGMKADVHTDNSAVIAELENKIADIKANCDLAIEGRDVKIMELEKEAIGFEENYTVYEVSKRKDGTDCTKKVCKVTVKEAYLAGAEPREKRIKQLEQENTQLKDKLEHRNCVDCSNHHSNIKFMKAKELLNMFLRLHYNPIVDEHTLFCKVEQFIKDSEVEK